MSIGDLLWFGGVFGLLCAVFGIGMIVYGRKSLLNCDAAIAHNSSGNVSCTDVQSKEAIVHNGLSIRALGESINNRFVTLCRSEQVECLIINTTSGGADSSAVGLQKIDENLATINARRT